MRTYCFHVEAISHTDADMPIVIRGSHRMVEPELADVVSVLKSHIVDFLKEQADVTDTSLQVQDIEAWAKRGLAMPDASMWSFLLVSDYEFMLGVRGLTEAEYEEQVIANYN